MITISQVRNGNQMHCYNNYLTSLPLIVFLRQEKSDLKVKYREPFDPNWSDDELLDQIIELDCSYHSVTLPDLPHCQELICHNSGLTSLPNLPECHFLYCANNRLTSLPDLPQCRTLNCAWNPITSLPDSPYEGLCCDYTQLTQLPDLPFVIGLHCHNNRLTSLPDLPQCQRLHCYNNNLTSLPDLPKCQRLHCAYNRLTALPDMPRCRKLNCRDNQITNLPHLPQFPKLCCYNNPLPLVKAEEWRLLWKIRRRYLALKYFRLWRKRMFEKKAEKKKDLHLELLWSPETKFYQQREEYLHFVESAQPKS